MTHDPIRTQSLSPHINCHLLISTFDSVEENLCGAQQASDGGSRQREKTGPITISHMYTETLEKQWEPDTSYIRPNVHARALRPGCLDGNTNDIGFVN